MPHQVTLVPGDSDAITTGVLSVLDTLGTSIVWDKPTPGHSRNDLLTSATRTGCALMGWQRGKRDEGELPPSVVLRKELGVFAQLRPIRSLPGLNNRFEDLDLLIVREVTEDVYAHLEHESIPGVYESVKVTTRAACERIARYAFELALMHGRKKVTIVHKANIMKLSDGLFLQTARAVAADYPQIEAEDCIVDALCMKLVLNPKQFDVLLCGNLFGDIVGDLCCGLVGGASNAPSINISTKGTALFCPGHGDAPGTPEQANPLRLLLPTVHMLRHLDEGEAATKLYQSIEQTLRDGVRPYALGGDADCSSFCTALNETLRKA
jgi:isocitrate dehydrogenase (NAD+)